MLESSVSPTVRSLAVLEHLERDVPCNEGNAFFFQKYEREVQPLSTLSSPSNHLVLFIYFVFSASPMKIQDLQKHKARRIPVAE